MVQSLEYFIYNFYRIDTLYILHSLGDYGTIETSIFLGVEIVKEKIENSHILMAVIGISFVVLVLGIGFFFDYLGEAKKAKINALNNEELLVYEIEQAKYDASVKSAVEDYINKKAFEDYSEFESLIGTEKYNWIKEEYNLALRNLYFDKNWTTQYDINEVIVELDEGGMPSFATENLLSIKRELLTSELEEKLFTEKVEKKLAEKELAQERAIKNVLATPTIQITSYEPQLGMTAQQVYDSTWGYPDRTTTSTTSYGVTEMWVYPESNYIHFKDGKVVGIDGSSN
ncbi:hypothetical protein WAX74_15060 [Psychrobacillus sp. FJAT-51614]|uniref:Regulatory protein YycH-like domain-containing protein n=1 Tax=Psychrobacillus mangrovi TaxID=3117745 RepID=A0ABU8F7H0_9BACI